jgi:hypothetical protein
MTTILLEKLLVSSFKYAGIKASTSESEEWNGEYVTITRLGGQLDQFGNATTGWTGKELVEMSFNVYSTGPIEALELSYEVARICKYLPLTYSVVSNPLLDAPAQMGWFNEQYGYTFGASFTVNQTNTQGG